MITPFVMVAAVDASRGIGKSGGLAWHLAADLKHFKDVTTSTADPAKQNAVIMGRKTWESLPEKFRPLPGRINAVLTAQAGFSAPPGVILAATMDGVFLALSGSGNVETVFVIGGARVFQEYIDHPQCRGLRLTELDRSFACDVFFPDVPARFKIVWEGPWMHEGDLGYRFVDYAA